MYKADEVEIPASAAVMKELVVELAEEGDIAPMMLLSVL